MVVWLLLCNQKVKNLHIARLPVFVKCLFCECLAHKDNPTMVTKCKLLETVSGDSQLHKYCLLLFLWSSPLVLLSWAIPGRPLWVPLECDRDGIRDDCLHLGLSSDFLVHGPHWRDKINNYSLLMKEKRKVRNRVRCAPICRLPKATGIPQSTEMQRRHMSEITRWPIS